MIVRELLTTFGIDFDEASAEKAQSGLEGLVDKAKILGAALAAGALVNGLRNLVIENAAIADAVGKTSSKLGVEVEALQELQFAAEQSGIAAGTFDTSLQRLTRRAAEAAMGTGVAKDSLEQMGVGLYDASGKMKAPPKLLADIADGMAKVEGNSERLRLAVSLFDTEGAAMVNMMAGGSAGLNALRQEARDLGSVLKKDTTDAAANLGDALNRVNHIFKGLKYAIMKALLPAFQGLVNLSVGLWQSFSKFEHKTQLIKAGLIVLGAVVSGLGVMLAATFGPALIAMVAPLVLPFMGIVAAVMAIGLAIDDLIAVFSGGESVLKNFWLYLSDGASEAWASVQDSFADFKAWLLSSLNGLATNTQELLASMVPDFLKSGLNSTLKLFADTSKASQALSAPRNISSSYSRSNISAPVNQSVSVNVNMGANSNPHAAAMEISKAVRQELDTERQIAFAAL